MVDKCVNEIVEASGGEITSKEARELLIDYVAAQEKLKTEGVDITNLDLTRDEAYERWLAKRGAQERFNRYNDVVKKLEFEESLDLKDFETAKKSIDDKFDFINEEIRENKSLRFGDFHSRLKAEGVDKIYLDRQFDQKVAAKYKAEFTTRNNKLKPKLKDVPPEFKSEYKIGKVMAETADISQAVMENLGVPIGYLEKRVGMNRHNSHTLSIDSEAKAWKEWALSDDHIDWDEMFTAGKTREEYLDEMLENIQSGNRSGDEEIFLYGLSDEGNMKKSREMMFGSLASSLGKQRKLMIKPDAWLDYNKRWGNGDLVASFNAELARSARIEALLANFGSNPKGNMESIINRVTKKTNKFAKGGTNKLTRHLEKRYEYVSGALDEEAAGVLARAGRSFRLFLSADKLGSAVFSSFSDQISPGLRQSQFLNEKNIGRNVAIAADSLQSNFRKMVGLIGDKQTKAIFRGALAEMETYSLFFRRELRWMDEFAVDAQGRPSATMLDRTQNLTDDVHRQ